MKRMICLILLSLLWLRRYRLDASVVDARAQEMTPR